jgi:copper resistance protein D
VLAVAKLLLYGGVALVIGVAALQRWRVFAVAGTTPASLRSTVGGSWLAIGIALVLMLTLQSRELEVDSWDGLQALLVATTWGRGFAVLTVCALLGALAWSMRWRDEFTAIVAGALAFALGGLGHAAADEHWPMLSRVADGAHVFGVGAWIGGLFLLARFAPHEHQRDAWASFSRRATLLAPLVLLTGIVSSWLRLRDSSLATSIQSDYGRLLLVKTLLALVVLAFGMRHRRHLERRTLPAAASVRMELAFAVLVLVATSLLTSTSPAGM